MYGIVLTMMLYYYTYQGEIDHKYYLKVLEIRRKYEAVHAQFRYATADTANAFTMDKKVYFETIADINRCGTHCMLVPIWTCCTLPIDTPFHVPVPICRYAAFQRKMVARCVKFIERKRFALLRSFVRTWKKAIAVFNEVDLETGHFEKQAIDGTIIVIIVCVSYSV